jgi:ATP-dependent RNA helicase DHX29
MALLVILAGTLGTFTSDRFSTDNDRRARYNRGRTRLVHVPEYLNSNSTNTHIVNAALVAGLYPKVLAVDPAAGQMRTIANNQVAYFHPTSVNRGRKPQDLGVHYLSYFTLM